MPSEALSPPAALAGPGLWSQWPGAMAPWTIGVEEEVMLLDPSDFSLASRADEVTSRLTGELAGHTGTETHGSALELRTDPHATVAEGRGQLEHLRAELARELDAVGLRAAVAGLHPFTLWQDTKISDGHRYRFLYGSMRELARREPTFALHVHVAVPDPESAILAFNRVRSHLPLLLALSANSPFCRGRDGGFASERAMIFDGFPRTGVPRRFGSYEEYEDAVDALVGSGALPDHTFLWWDVRLQPSLGTVEVRVMDAQSSVEDTVALVALVQSLARLALEEPPAARETIPEVLAENRFIAARDGMDARLIDTPHRGLVPVCDLVQATLARCRPHASALGCAVELEGVARLALANGADRQRRVFAETGDLGELLARQAQCFCQDPQAVAPQPRLPVARFVRTDRPVRAPRGFGSDVEG